MGKKSAYARNFIEQIIGSSFQDFLGLLSEVRDSLEMPSEFRDKNETSVIYNYISNDRRDRFLDGTRISNLLGLLCEAVSIVSSRYSQLDAANIIKAHLLITPAIRDTAVLNILFLAIKRPDLFQGNINAKIMELLQHNCSGYDSDIRDVKDSFFSDSESRNLLASNRHMSPAKIHDVPQNYQASYSLIARIFSRSDNINDDLRTLFTEVQQSINDGRNLVDVASILHHGIIRIHPYSDGNGRLARNLANKVLRVTGIECINPKTSSILEEEYDRVVALDTVSDLSSWICKQDQQAKLNKSSLAISIAAQKGNIDELKRLLTNELQEPIDLNRPATNAKGNTPLHYACHSGHFEAAEMLMRHGASPLQQNDAKKDCFAIIKVKYQVERERLKALHESMGTQEYFGASTLESTTMHQSVVEQSTSESPHHDTEKHNTVHQKPAVKM